MSKILLVEDDTHQQLLYREELQAEGYDLVCASDGKEAIKLAEKENPDLIIMDISMPGIDGIEAMGRILSRNNKVPVILNTAYSSYKDNFMSWSADAYVIKSSDLTELKSVVRKVLQRSEKSAEKKP